MFDSKITSPGEFKIAIDLLFWREIWLRDNRLGIDDKICIFSEILGLMSDKYLESLRPESIQKWRICSIRTRYTVPKTLIISSQS